MRAGACRLLPVARVVYCTAAVVCKYIVFGDARRVVYCRATIECKYIVFGVARRGSPRSKFTTSFRPKRRGTRRVAEKSVTLGCIRVCGSIHAKASHGKCQVFGLRFLDARRGSPRSKFTTSFRPKRRGTRRVAEKSVTFGCIWVYGSIHAKASHGKCQAFGLRQTYGLRLDK